MNVHASVPYVQQPQGHATPKQTYTHLKGEGDVLEGHVRRAVLREGRGRMLGRLGARRLAEETRLHGVGDGLPQRQTLAALPRRAAHVLLLRVDDVVDVHVRLEPAGAAVLLLARLGRPQPAHPRQPEAPRLLQVLRVVVLLLAQELQVPQPLLPLLPFRPAPAPAAVRAVRAPAQARGRQALHDPGGGPRHGGGHADGLGADGGRGLLLLWCV